MIEYTIKTALGGREASDLTITNLCSLDISVKTNYAEMQ
jgi:hypothetical protein